MNCLPHSPAPKATRPRLTHGCIVVDKHPVKERFADRHKPLMKLAPALVKLVVGHIFEMERTRVIKRMIGHRPLLGGRRFSDGKIAEIRGLRQRKKLPLKGGTLLGREVLLQPKIDVMNDHWGLVSNIELCSVGLSTRQGMAIHRNGPTLPKTLAKNCLPLPKLGLFPPSPGLRQSPPA